MSKNGTLVNGPTFVAGKYGNALSLNGTNQSATLPTVFDPTAVRSYTFEGWVKFTDAGTRLLLVIGAAGPSSNNNMWFGANGGKMQLSYGTTAGGTGTAVVNDGAEHHVALVVTDTTPANNGGTVTGTFAVYVDGLLDALTSLLPNHGLTWTPAANSPFFLGFWTAAANFFNGTADDVVFTAGPKYTANFAAPLAPTPPNLRGQLALYPMDGTTGDTMIADSSTAASLPSLNVGVIGDSIPHYNNGNTYSTPAQLFEIALANALPGVSPKVYDQSINSMATGDWLPGTANWNTATAAFDAAGVTDVIVCLGMNNARQATPAATVAANLASIATGARSHGYNSVTIVLPSAYDSSRAAAVDPGYTPANLTLLSTYAASITAGTANAANGIYVSANTLYAVTSANPAQLADGVHPGKQLVPAFAQAYAAAFLGGRFASGLTAQTSATGGGGTGSASSFRLTGSPTAAAGGILTITVSPVGGVPAGNVTITPVATLNGTVALSCTPNSVTLGPDGGPQTFTVPAATAGTITVTAPASGSLTNATGVFSCTVSAPSAAAAVAGTAAPLQNTPHLTPGGAVSLPAVAVPAGGTLTHLCDVLLDDVGSAGFTLSNVGANPLADLAVKWASTTSGPAATVLSGSGGTFTNSPPTVLTYTSPNPHQTPSSGQSGWDLTTARRRRLELWGASTLGTAVQLDVAASAS